MSIPFSDMNEQPSPQRAISPEREAERWFARLRSPACSEQERLAFGQWRAQLDNARAYATTEALWNELSALREDPGMRAMIIGARAPRRRWRSRWPAAIAALLLIAATGGLLRLHGADDAASLQHYASGDRETRVVVLDDGSRVTLNADSAIDARYTRAARRLALLRGEALFDVRHDAARPFIVMAASGEIIDLGTRFLVRRDAGQVTVTLLEGRVDVARETTRERVALQPGEQLRFAATGAFDRHRVDPGITDAWTRGRLIFRATPLAAALAEVNRYAAPRIRVDDTALAATPISGTVRIGDGQSMAAALVALLAVDLQPQDDGDLLLVPR